MDRNVKKVHFDGVDGLRAYSAFGIVAMHILSNGFNISEGFVFSSLIPSFTNLVYLFMVVSAFGMCCGYHERIKNREIDLSAFYSKRFKKTLPFFAFLVFMDLAISPSLNSLYEGFADLTLVFGLLPKGGGISVVGVGWFLGLVFVFYMLFPFFVFLTETRKRAWFAMIILLIYNLFCSDYFDIGKQNILYSGCYFMAGGLIYLYKDYLIRLKRWFRTLVILLNIAFVLLHFFVGGSTLTMLPMFSLMLMYTVVGEDACKRILLSNPLTKFISGISMEIYLSHMVIYRVIEKAGVLYLFGEGKTGYFVALTMVVVGVVAFSFVTQRTINLIEKKLVKWDA